MLGSRLRGNDSEGRDDCRQARAGGYSATHDSPFAATNQWLIHSGLGGADETITLMNGAPVDPTDVQFM